MDRRIGFHSPQEDPGRPHTGVGTVEVVLQPAQKLGVLRRLSRLLRGIVSRVEKMMEESLFFALLFGAGGAVALSLGGLSLLFMAGVIGEDPVEWTTCNLIGVQETQTKQGLQKLAFLAIGFRPEGASGIEFLGLLEDPKSPGQGRLVVRSAGDINWRLPLTGKEAPPEPRGSDIVTPDQIHLDLGQRR
jgi:hypothetical protein